VSEGVAARVSDKGKDELHLSSRGRRGRAHRAAS